MHVKIHLTVSGKQPGQVRMIHRELIFKAVFTRLPGKENNALYSLPLSEEDTVFFT